MAVVAPKARIIIYCDVPTRGLLEQSKHRAQLRIRKGKGVLWSFGKSETLIVSVRHRTDSRLYTDQIWCQTL